MPRHVEGHVVLSTAFGTRNSTEIPRDFTSALGRSLLQKWLRGGRKETLPVEARDVCTRECLALVADSSIPGLRVARELDRIVAGPGRRGAVAFDNVTPISPNTILT